MRLIPAMEYGAYQTQGAPAPMRRIRQGIYKGNYWRTWLEPQTERDHAPARGLA